MRAQFKCRKEILHRSGTSNLQLLQLFCRIFSHVRHVDGIARTEEFEKLARGSRRSRTFKPLNPLPRHIIVNGMSIITIVVSSLCFCDRLFFYLF